MMPGRARPTSYWWTSTAIQTGRTASVWDPRMGLGIARICRNCCGVSVADSAARLSHRLVQKRDRARPCIGGSVRAVGVRVGGILESVSRAVVDLYVNPPPHALHSFLKRLNVRRRNAAIVCAETAEDGREDLLNVVWIGWQRAIIHHARGEVRLMNRELQ